MHAFYLVPLPVGWIGSPSQIYVWCPCVMSWRTQFLTTSQFLAGVYLIGICWDEIEACPAPLCDSQMSRTHGVHKVQRFPCADNASRMLPPQSSACGNQTSQDEIPSSLTSCPVVSWKCFILLSTGKKKKRGTDGNQGQHWRLREKAPAQGRGLPTFSLGTDLPFVNDRQIGVISSLF